jgi:hypothetical protein
MAPTSQVLRRRAVGAVCISLPNVSGAVSFQGFCEDTSPVIREKKHTNRLIEPNKAGEAAKTLALAGEALRKP